MRKHARRDDNHRAIVDALRVLGATVLDLADVGGGCPDVLVGFRGKNVLLEIKDGRKPPSACNLTIAEAAFIERWRGDPVRVVESVADALLAIGVVATPLPGRDPNEDLPF